MKDKKRTETFGIMEYQYSNNNQLDPLEPLHIAKKVKNLDLKHVLINSEIREDLIDGGAYHLANTIKEIKKINSETSVEIVIHDFKEEKYLDVIMNAKPDVINHNIKTIDKLKEKVNKKISYYRSLYILKYIKEKSPEILTRTGILVGIGEDDYEVYKMMDDALEAKCDFFTIGQYDKLKPKDLYIKENISLDKFEEYRRGGIERGFLFIASSPHIRII